MSDSKPDVTDLSAQDVIDALRLALVAQNDPAEVVKIVDVMLEFAPPTDGSRGVTVLMGLIAESSLKVAMVDA